jgi:2-succinyl-5-enolpyruvyl-6-hydroxy-3-cyclohexene-1-carboxylate synthase
VGNSLSIREWDLCAHQPFSHYVHCHRGANGIDGLISGFYGLCEGLENWCVLGDLSALYDLNSLWAASLRAETRSQVVVINNGGGRIFTPMFRNELFENQHQLHFGSWAEMFAFDYLQLKQPQALPPSTHNRVIEVIPDADQTHHFWLAYRGFQS